MSTLTLFDKDVLESGRKLGLVLLFVFRLGCTQVPSFLQLPFDYSKGHLGSFRLGCMSQPPFRVVLSTYHSPTQDAHAHNKG